MRNRLPKSTILIAFAALIAAQCHNRNSARYKMGLLTKAAWRYEKAGFVSTQGDNIDVLDPRITDCQKDELTFFYEDGTGSFDAGKPACEASDPPSLPFFWAFDHNASNLYFQDQNFIIKTLSDKKLEIYTNQDFEGTRTKFIIVFKH